MHTAQARLTLPHQHLHGNVHCAFQNLRTRQKLLCRTCRLHCTAQHRRGWLVHQDKQKGWGSLSVALQMHLSRFCAEHMAVGITLQNCASLAKSASGHLREGRQHRQAKLRKLRGGWGQCLSFMKCKPKLLNMLAVVRWRAIRTEQTAALMPAAL